MNSIVNLSMHPFQKETIHKYIQALSQYILLISMISNVLYFLISFLVSRNERKYN